MKKILFIFLITIRLFAFDLKPGRSISFNLGDMPIEPGYCFVINGIPDPWPRTLNQLEYFIIKYHKKFDPKSRGFYVTSCQIKNVDWKTLKIIK